MFSFCRATRPRGRQSDPIIWPTMDHWRPGLPIKLPHPCSRIPPTPLHRLLRLRTLTGNFIHSVQGTTGVNFHNFPSANTNFHHLRVPTGRAAQRGATFSMWCMSGGLAWLGGPTRRWCRYRCRSSDSFPPLPKPTIPTHMLEQTAGRWLMESGRNLCNTLCVSPP